MTQGMYGEPVEGYIYHMPTPEGPHKAFSVKEVVQATPWSSGPMIFTHLVGTLTKESGQDLVMSPYYSWMLDPCLDETFDYETGRYYVKGL